MAETTQSDARKRKIEELNEDMLSDRFDELWLSHFTASKSNPQAIRACVNREVEECKAELQRMVAPFELEVLEGNWLSEM